MKKVTGTKLTTFTNADGVTTKLIIVTKTDENGNQSTDTVEVGSIFDPTSKNYDAEKDNIGE